MDRQDAGNVGALTTLQREVADGGATVTLNRPDVHNAFDPTMTEELARVWGALRTNDDVRAIVLTGAGDKAFCTGLDRSSVAEFRYNPLTYEDPVRLLAPKSPDLPTPTL